MQERFRYAVIQYDATATPYPIVTHASGSLGEGPDRQDHIDRGQRLGGGEGFQIPAEGEEETSANLDPIETRNRKATIVIEHLIQASDVSHTMQ